MIPSVSLSAILKLSFVSSIWVIAITNLYKTQNASFADVCSAFFPLLQIAHLRTQAEGEGTQNGHEFSPIESHPSTTQPMRCLLVRERRGIYSLATLGSLEVVAVDSTWRQQREEVKIRGYFGWMAVRWLLSSYISLIQHFTVVYILQEDIKLFEVEL